MISDAAEGITHIEWNVYGKIKRIQRTASTLNPVTEIVYHYDAAGNRIGKEVTKSDNTQTHTWYVRDASGNVLAVYGGEGTATTMPSTLTQNEVHLYGSSRLGIRKRPVTVSGSYTPAELYSTYRGDKFFEGANHLGNVLVTLGDTKRGVDSNSDGAIDYYEPHVASAQDYYPFGMLMPGRTYSSGYRYGFNGKENDNEVKGTGNQQDYGFRIYDPRIVRFNSIDPLTSKYPMLTPYQFSGNFPIAGVDLDGKEFKLSIYDPVQAQNFLNAYNSGDIYQARGIAYQAMNATFSPEEEKAFLEKKGTRIVHYNSAGQLMKGSLTYDASLPPGVTMELSLNKSEVNGIDFIEQETSYWAKGTGDHPEAGYPVDVKTINSPEYQDFYKDHDFVAKYRLTYGSPIKAGPAAAEGWIDGNLKGYGNVTYDFKAFGLGTRGIGQEMGMLTGSFNLKNTSDFSPGVIAGYGGSYTYGAGMALRGTWYSFQNQTDMLKFKKTANATISGEINAWSFGFGGAKVSGSATYSITTLRKPTISGKLGTSQQLPNPNP